MRDFLGRWITGGEGYWKGKSRTPTSAAVKAKMSISQKKRCLNQGLMLRTVCTQLDCGKKTLAKGFCPMHYSRMRRNQSLVKPEQMGPETRAKISIAKIGKPGPWLGKVRGPHSAETKAKMRVAHLGKPNSENHTRNILAARWHGQRPEYSGIKFRSSYEVRLAKEFDRRGIRWLYEPKRFNLGTCSYLPDFYLPESESYWEAKGYFAPESQVKVRLFRELHPETPLIVATRKVIEIMEV